MMEIIFFTLLLILIFELFLYRLVNFLRKYYENSHNWIKNRYVTNIITKEKDFFPKIDKKDLSRFKLYMHDKYLGSIYKKNTTVIENYFNKKKIRTKYNIQKNGARNNRLFNKKNYISTYGDSLAFCRYVNDNETWQYYLSKKTKSNVKNFGVGNYGLDQSFLRYKKNKNDKSKILIFAIGPETIRRNLSLWKHYYEFGNIYYFKPAFIINKKKKLVEKKLPLKNILEKTNFFRIHDKIKNYDIFYKEKFLNYLWSKPYCLSLFNNFFRKSSLIVFFTLKYIEINFKSKIMKNINKKMFPNFNLLGGLKFDFEDRLKYFKNKNYYNNTLKLIKLIQKDLKKNNKKVLLLIMPAHYDLVNIREKKSNYYQEFIDSCRKDINCLDLSQYLNKDSNILFADKGFGGHYNYYGNKQISEILYKHLKKINYI